MWSQKGFGKIASSEEILVRSHYANYVKEREGFEVIENEKGFFEFKINSDDCYIRTMYVAPEFRAHGAAKELAHLVEETARANGCKYLVGTIIPSLNKTQATESMGIQLKYGFKIEAAHEDVIILRKEL
jgi:GNAT superfamily N-acetyltransferase